MVENERTRDIYEENAAYPKPPLVPLPDPDDLIALDELGLKPVPAARKIMRSAMNLVGFRAFQKDLPHTIEDLLRRVDLRGAFLFAPVISAVLALKDDPRDLSPTERAASLLFAVRSLYDEITSGSFPPDQFRGQALEMGQYPNLFSTNLIIENKRARIFKSTNVSRATVVAGRRFYSLEMGNLGSETSFEQLKEALDELARAAQMNRLKAFEPAPGLLTSASHLTQLKAFTRLEKNPVNREFLSILRHSFVTLCLDLESNPATDVELAYLGFSGNPANRWFHSSLQLVVFGNAKACAICNFSTYLDGNTMMRAAAEIQKRAAVYPTQTGEKKSFASLPPAKELKWQMGFRPLIQARRDLSMVQDNQQATFEIQDIGRKFFAAHQVDAVPAFILALQMTAKRFTGKLIPISQFLTMSKYRYMDLVTAVVTTPEVSRFVEYMDGGGVQSDQARTLLQEAIESQARECRIARRHMSMDDIFGFFLLTRKGVQRRFAGPVTILARLLLRVLGLTRPMGRQILVSHPEIYPEVSIVGRPGVRLPYVKYFGLHYQIWEERIVITMMPGTNWTIPNSEFIAELHANLKRIQSIIV